MGCLDRQSPSWTATVFISLVLVSAASVSSVARGTESVSPYRILDVGLRPLVSFPEALGINAEVHPLGGALAIEGGVGMSPVQSFTYNAALKYRFTLYSGPTFQFSMGPGIGSHWFFERDFPINGQLVTAFAATEAVWWGKRVGFRIALDLGIATPLWDDPGNANLGTWPVFNSSVGLAFRTAK